MIAFDEGELTEKLSPIFRKYNIQKAILLGSPAPEKAARRRDLELILIQKSANHFFDRYQGVLQEIDLAVSEKDLDVFIYTPQELQEISHRPFIASALDEGKVIYEQ